MGSASAILPRVVSVDVAARVHRGGRRRRGAVGGLLQGCCRAPASERLLQLKNAKSVSVGCSNECSH